MIFQLIFYKHRNTAPGDLCSACKVIKSCLHVSTIVRRSLCLPYHPLHSSPKAGVFKRQIFPPPKLPQTLWTDVTFFLCLQSHQLMSACEHHRSSLSLPYHPLHASPLVYLSDKFSHLQISPNILPLLLSSPSSTPASPPLGDLTGSLSIYNLNPQSFYTSHISLTLIQSQGTPHLVSPPHSCISFDILTILSANSLHAAELSKGSGLASLFIIPYAPPLNQELCNGSINFPGCPHFNPLSTPLTLR